MTCGRRWRRSSGLLWRRATDHRRDQTGMPFVGVAHAERQNLHTAITTGCAVVGTRSSGVVLTPVLRLTGVVRGLKLGIPLHDRSALSAEQRPGAHADVVEPPTVGVRPPPSGFPGTNRRQAPAPGWAPSEPRRAGPLLNPVQWAGGLTNPCPPDALDGAVAAAYGWSAEVSDERGVRELLARNGKQRVCGSGAADNGRRGCPAPTVRIPPGLRAVDGKSQGPVDFRSKSGDGLRAAGERDRTARAQTTRPGNATRRDKETVQ